MDLNEGRGAICEESSYPLRSNRDQRTTLLELSWALVGLLGDDRRAVEVTTEFVRQGWVRAVDGRTLVLEGDDARGEFARAPTTPARGSAA